MEIALHLAKKNELAQTLVSIGADTSKLELHLTDKYEVAEALTLVEKASCIDVIKYAQLLLLLDVLVEKRKLSFICDMYNAQEQLEMDDLEDEEVLDRADNLLTLI